MRLEQGKQVGWQLGGVAMLAVLLVFGVGFLGAEPAVGQTALKVTNTLDHEVTVGLVMAALGGACNKNHPPVKITDVSFCEPGTIIVPPGQHGYAGKCKFKLGKAGSKTATRTIPTPAGKCQSGALAFGDFGQCATGVFPQGLSQAEWTLNVPAGDEAVDISLVNGFNGYIEIAFDGEGWAYGPNKTLISNIENNALNQNAGNPGVYPNGCTTCTQRVNPPCTKPPHPAGNSGCQSQAICNIQRTGSGGVVEIFWHGPTASVAKAAYK